jgi:hypothetical protein
VPAIGSGNVDEFCDALEESFAGIVRDSYCHGVGVNVKANDA